MAKDDAVSDYDRILIEQFYEWYAFTSQVYIQWNKEFKNSDAVLAHVYTIAYWFLFDSLEELINNLDPEQDFNRQYILDIINGYDVNAQHGGVALTQKDLYAFDIFVKFLNEKSN